MELDIACRVVTTNKSNRRFACRLAGVTQSFNGKLLPVGRETVAELCLNKNEGFIAVLNQTVYVGGRDIAVPQAAKIADLSGKVPIDYLPALRHTQSPRIP